MIFGNNCITWIWTTCAKTRWERYENTSCCRYYDLAVFVLPCFIATSHTRAVVRECCKGDEASQWRNPKFDPPPRPNPISDRNTNRHTWLRRGPLHLCNSSSRSAQAFRFCACVTLRIKNVLVFWVLATRYMQPRAVDGFWRKIRQNMRFRPRMCLFGVANIKSNI